MDAVMLCRKAVLRVFKFLEDSINACYLDKTYCCIVKFLKTTMMVIPWYSLGDM